MERSWFSDDAAPDLAPALGRGEFLKRMWEVVRESHSVRSSTVFGLVGAWGAGKTSMLDWLERQADADQREPSWTFVRFNPWDFQDAASLQLGFFNELTNAFGGPQKSDKVRAKVAAFGRAVAPFGSLGAVVGADLSKSVDAAAALIDGNRSVAASRRKLEKALKAAKAPVLVVIDDLDRVSADELLLTLKLVRQLGRLPHVHYLLSYDESTILDVLTRTTLIGEQTPARARDYMEKVVQVRFDVPRLRSSDSLRLVNEALDALSTATGFNLTDDDASRYATAYFGFLSARLDTPRAIKRYFAQVRLLSPTMKGEVDYVDFLVLTWIRTSEPGVYALLQKRRSELVGTARYGTYGRNRDSELQAESDAWRDSLVAAGVREEDVPGVAGAVSFLFPRFDAAWRASAGSGDRAKEPRVANDSYFDRYFSFGLTDDDIADSTVRKAVEAHDGESPERSVAVLRVQLAIEENPELVVGKLSRDILEYKPSSPALYSWLAKLYSGLPPSKDIVSPGRQLENLISVSLRGMGSEEVTAIMLKLIDQDAQDLLLSVLDRAVRPSSVDERSQLTLTTDQIAIIRAVQTEKLGAADPTAMDTATSIAAWAWSRLDPEGFAAWIESMRKEHDDLDVAAFFVGSSNSVGSRGAHVWLRGLDLPELARHLNIDELRAKYRQEIAQVQGAQADEWDGPEDTPDNRRQLTLIGLKQREESPDEPA